MTKKRANGEGSIRKRANGRWEGRYTVGIDYATGRAIQRSVSGRTQNECKDKLKRAIADNRGIPINHNGDYTVAEWCNLWFEIYSKPNLRPNTVKNYSNGSAYHPRHRHHQAASALPHAHPADVQRSEIPWARQAQRKN